MFSHECQENKCDYLFLLDSIAHIDHPDTLIELINYNRTIVAPMLLRPGQSWSNFWGDYSDDGFYQRSMDYMDFVDYKKMFDRIYKELFFLSIEIYVFLGDFLVFHMLHMLI